MQNLQIKTLELLIANELQNPNPQNQNVFPAFDYMLNHYADEEYLHGIEHRKIISMIYLKNCYKYKTARALGQELHVDPKALLACRKSYVRLFAKQFLNLSTPTPNDYYLLHDALKRIKEAGSFATKQVAFADDSRRGKN